MNLPSLFTEAAGQIAGSIVIAVIAFTLGNFRRAIVQRMLTRHTRKYWNPFRSKGLAIVVGSFSPASPPSSVRHRAIDTSPLKEFEPYGLVGFGEVLAILAIQEHLKLLGWDNVVVAQPSDVRTFRSKNLVLIGGPDPNPVTDLAMHHGRLPVRFVDNVNNRTQMLVTLSREGNEKPNEQMYAPMFLPEDPSKIVRDYGFVAQVPSPYSEECTAILLVGTYGAATLAAAQLVTSSYGVSRMRRVNAGRCLTIFHTDIGRNGDISFPRIDRCEVLDKED